MSGAAAFIVRMFDRHGLPAHAYGVCAAHAPEDTYAQHALATGAYDVKDRTGRVLVSRARRDARYHCERCHPE